MLKARILTVMVVLPLFLAALFFLDLTALALLFAILLALGLREWANLSGIRSASMRFFYVVAGVGMASVIWLTGYAGRELFLLTLLFWFVALFRLWRYTGEEDGKGNASLAWLDGYFVLIPATLGLLLLMQRDADSPLLVLVVMFIIWAADTGAYLVGRAFGRHRLAPRISPGKTIEGLAGGLAGALLVAVTAGVWAFDLSGRQLAAWSFLAVLIALFSVAGDLFESMLKRRAGQKDSGRLLPGHGGVLDRIDSLCAALPLYLLSMDYLGALA